MHTTDLRTYSDRELVTLISKSNNEAFTQLYNRYWDKLLFIAGIKLRDLAVAEEMVQDVFLDIWNRRETLNITGQVEAYLAISMKYKVINAQAKHKKNAEYQRYLLGYAALQDNSTEEWLNFNELKEKLAHFVNKLPERCKLTYRLSSEACLSQKEIADKLDVSEKAVEANLSRAKKSLRLSMHEMLSSFMCLLP